MIEIKATSFTQIEINTTISRFHRLDTKGALPRGSVQGFDSQQSEKFSYEFSSEVFGRKGGP